MARVTHVKKAQKDQGRCEVCGKPIEAGAAYKWCKPRSHRGAVGYKRKRHEACRSWRPSELTSSPALSTLYAAQETAGDDLEAWDRESLDDLRSIIEALAEGVREAASVYEEGASNIEDGFGHATSTSEELAEKAEALNSAADDVEGAADELEEWDEDDARQEAIALAGIEDLDAATYDWDEDPEDLQSEVDDAKEDWATTQADIVQSAIDSAEAM